MTTVGGEKLGKMEQEVGTLARNKKSKLEKVGKGKWNPLRPDSKFSRHGFPILKEADTSLLLNCIGSVYRRIWSI